VLLWAAKVVERIDVLFQVCKTKRLGGAVMLNFLLKLTGLILGWRVHTKVLRGLQYHGGSLLWILSPLFHGVALVLCIAAAFVLLHP
jgi:hypothetical protein